MSQGTEGVDGCIRACFNEQCAADYAEPLHVFELGTCIIIVQ